MKKSIYLITFLLSASLMVKAQKTNPAPYCASEFNNNYNMMKELASGAYSYKFGAVGSVTTPNTYLYVDTAHLPNISKSATTTIYLDFFNVDDVQPAYFAVWIDYDQSNTFDTSELIYHNANTAKGKLPSGATGSDISIPMAIKAPAAAKNGITRMRITRAENPANPTGAYSSSFRLSPCATKVTGANTYGCTYDFNVTIVGVSEIDELMLRNQLNISPNPATEKISINNSSNQKMSNIAVYDLSGKRLFESNEATQEINISNYTPGIYFVKITMESGVIIPMRFVKN